MPHTKVLFRIHEDEVKCMHGIMRYKQSRNDLKSIGECVQVTTPFYVKDLSICRFLSAGHCETSLLSIFKYFSILHSVFSCTTNGRRITLRWKLNWVFREYRLARRNSNCQSSKRKRLKGLEISASKTTETNNAVQSYPYICYFIFKFLLRNSWQKCTY